MAAATGPARPLITFVPPPPDPTPTFPPLEMNFHPDIWRHEKVVGRPNVVERVVEVESPQQRPEQVVAPTHPSVASATVQLSVASVSAHQPQTTTETVRSESLLSVASVSAHEPQTTTETVRSESLCECIWRIFKNILLYILLIPCAIYMCPFMLCDRINSYFASRPNPTPPPPMSSLEVQQPTSQQAPTQQSSPQQSSPQQSTPQQSTPQQTNRRREWQVTHEITETFTCQDRSRISINDIRLILAHIYAPYKPLDSGPDVVQRACEIFGNVQQVNTFTIVAKRTTANWQEPSRLEVSYNIGQGPVAFPVLSRDARFFADRNSLEYHHDRTPNRLMQPGATVVVPHDNLMRIDESPIRTEVGWDQMGAALRWLGYDPSGFAMFITVLNSWLSGDPSEPYRTYQERQANANHIIHFEHSGHWIIRLHEDNGQKSIKCILQQPGGGTFPDANSVQQQLQQLLNAAYNRHSALRQMNIQPFVSPGDSQIGYEIRLPQQ